MRKLLALALIAVAFSAPAKASFGPSAVLSHPNTRVITPLSALSGVNVIADLDATASASTNGTSQIWSNLITSPADGTTQSANNFYLGASTAVGTEDPTFNGTAGSTTANWTMSGSNYFNLAASNSTFLSTLQNDSENWWVAISFTVTGTSYQTLWSTLNNSASTGIALVVNPGSGTKFALNQYTTSAATVTYNPTGGVTTGANYIAIVSHSAGGHTRFWVNSTTNTESSTAFVSGSAAAVHVMQLGTRNSVNSMANGSIIRSFSYGTDYLTNAQEALIIHAYESRHQIDYDANGTIGN